MLLSVACVLGAQSAIDSAENTDNSRPVESEIFLDEGIGADEVAAQEPVELPGIGLGDIVRVILVLGIVIVLIYGFIWLLKKFSAVKTGGDNAIHLLSSRALKSDVTLYLIGTGSRVFLIGSSGNSLNLISEIDDKDSINEIRIQALETPVAPRGGFAKLIRAKFGFLSPNAEKTTQQEVGPVQNESVDSVSFLRKQRERLKDL